jgi:hypothetical protein
MFDDALTALLRRLGGTPCFRVYGKGGPERDWRVIDVYASPRRDRASRWPLCRATCTTFTPELVVVGWDHALEVWREQLCQPASRDGPVVVAGGRLRDCDRRLAAGGEACAPSSEVLAHECGHTWQARRMRSGLLYLPVVGAVTLFGEGRRPWNFFENQASEVGQFGGLVEGSASAELLRRLP